MKLFLYSILFLFFLPGCEYDVIEHIDPVDPSVNEKCDTDIGSFKLLSTSFSAMPYYGKSKVIFTDSLANLAEFTIHEFDTYVINGVLYRYNVNEPGDTVKYCYASENKGFSVSDTTLKIYLSLSLKASPYYSDPESGKVADVLNINYRNLSDTVFISWQVFYKLVDQRTYPDPYTTNEFFSSISFHGRDFQNVERTKFSNPKLELYYNQTEGIVAFRDKTNKLWRFDSMN